MFFYLILLFVKQFIRNSYYFLVRHTENERLLIHTVGFSYAWCSFGLRFGDIFDENLFSYFEIIIIRWFIELTVEVGVRKVFNNLKMKR